MARKTYGTVKVRNERWVVDAKRHVALRFKRLFVGTIRYGPVLELTPSRRVARDLEWFLDRYPMEISPKLLSKIRRMAAEHRAGEAAVDVVLGEGYVAPEYPMALPPRDYQRLGASMLLATGRLLLADDLGLGKTVTAIATLTDKRTLPCLVVTMTHLVHQWSAEIARFMPQLRVHALTKATAAYEPPPSDVIVTNYHKLVGWAETLGGAMKSVVFDECQELRRPDSQKWDSAKHVAGLASFCMGLSATPIYNYGGEMHSVLDVLTRGEVGTRSEFMAEWGDTADHIKDPKAFGLYLREEGLMLRRTRSEVGREIPPIQSVVHKVDADLKALEHVNDRVAALARIILRTEAEAEKGERMRASEEISWRLRQATGIAKAPYVAEFVKLLGEGEKVVLFGWHKEVYAIWKDKLKDLNPVFYTGDETAAQKEESKKRFLLDPRCRVMVISLRAGQGLDGLQAVCRTAVFGELDWSPGVHEQCIGRVARDGQSDPVVAYYLVSDYGADPVMADVVEAKEQQALGIRDPDAELLERVQVDPERIRKLAADYLMRHSSLLRSGPVEPGES